MTLLRTTRTVLFSLAATVFGAAPGAAQETFQYVGPTGQQTWELPGNWTGGGGAFSQWPGQAPESGTLDSADLSGARSADLDVQIAAPGLKLDTLVLGANGLAETVVSGAPGATLSVAEIQPRGGVFATNRLTVDLLLEDDLAVRNALSPLTIEGGLINSNPTSQRDVANGSDRTLTLTGATLLSDAVGLPGHLRFVNEGSSDTSLRGSISDGAAAGGEVTYARGVFDLVGENSYTGRTTVGDNDPNTETTVVLHTDLAFGASLVVIGGGNALKIVRSAFGKGPRVIGNDLQLAREVSFEGGEVITLNGVVSQSNGRRLSNNIAPTGSLVINGDVYASTSSDVREWVFDGAGLTVVNGVIDDSLGDSRVDGASLAKAGVGRVVLTNPAVAAYGGPTHVNDGVLQLGDGGTAVDLNDQDVSGDGELEIKHAGELTFSARMTGGLTLRHTGAGVTRLDRASTADGPVIIEHGVLSAMAGGVGSSATGSGSVSVLGGTLAGSGRVAGAVLADDGGRVAPGESVGTLDIGSLDLRQNATLEIEIAGAAMGTGYDSLQVAGGAVLAGDLAVSLDGFTPAAGDEFTILTAASISGQFANASSGTRIDTLEGAGSFLVTYEAGAALLSGFAPAALAGDYNGDGLVDAADYTVWRDGGAPDSGPAGYQLWVDNYGSGAAAPPATAASAPEPLSALLLAAALVAAAGQRARE